MDKTVFDHQAQQKRDHDAGARFRECFVGEQVLAYDTMNRTWKEGVIAERTGPTSYVVQMQGGEVLWKRHIDHIKPLTFASPSSLLGIPSQAAQHFGPCPYLPCMTDVPPVKLTNPEGAVPLTETTLTQTAVPPPYTPQLQTWQKVFLNRLLVIQTHLSEGKVKHKSLLFHHQWILLPYPKYLNK